MISTASGPLVSLASNASRLAPQAVPSTVGRDDYADIHVDWARFPIGPDPSVRCKRTKRMAEQPSLRLRRMLGTDSMSRGAGDRGARVQFR
jgi:hypothetical protein